MNLPGPYSFPIVIVLVAITLGTAFAADTNEPRVNPFALPPGVYSKDHIPKKQPQRLVLQAIFHINGKRIATISGENFMKGDLVFGKRVINIFDNRVILDAGGKEEILALKKMQFEIHKNRRK